MSRIGLETERLRLREIELDDLNFFAEMLGDPTTMHFWPRPQSRQEAAEWIDRHRQRYADHGYGFWIVVRKADGVPIGQAGLLHQEIDGESKTGLGYMIHHPFWGQGYAIEATRACLKYGFETLGLKSVTVLIRPENTRSAHLAKKLGATLQRSTEYSGYLHDVYEVIPNASRYDAGMATSLKAYVVDRLRAAAKRYGEDLAASSPETLSLKPGGSARSAFDYTYEVVLVNRRLAKRLSGEDPGPYANDGWIVAPADFCDKATAQMEFQTSAEAVIAAIEAEPEDQLDRVIPIPSGQTSPLDLASLTIGHWTYHDGQMNYAQAIAGDEKVHWE